MSRMMLALTLFAVVLLILFIPLGLLESRRTPDWQAELSRYLDSSGISLEDIRLAEVAEAQSPGQFAAQMLKARPAGWTWLGIDQIPHPDRVRCVRIERQGTAQPPIREYLLISYHSDEVWRAGWLVHEFREGVSEEEQQALLTRLGCNDWTEIFARMRYQPAGS